MNHASIHVLMVVEGEIATTHLMERILNACSPYGVRYTKVLYADLTPRHLDSETVPLFVRNGDPSLMLWIKLLRRAKHPYLYYIDDNFWELEGDSPLAQYYRHPDVRKSLEFAVSNAHLVITNSEILAAYLRRFTARLRVLPPFFDFAVIKGFVPEPTDEIRIVFAGSISRVDDLHLIGPSLIQAVLDRIPNAVFEFCGVLPAGVEPGPRIRFFEHKSSYAEFMRFQVGRNWAIGIAPLRNTASNRAKTNNKYTHYGACGNAGIYSDMPPYQGVIEPGVTGLLVEPTSDAWLAAILQLALEPERRQQIARNAERDVRERYSVESVAGIWADCIREVRHLLPDAGVDRSFADLSPVATARPTALVRAARLILGRQSPPQDLRENLVPLWNYCDRHFSIARSTLVLSRDVNEVPYLEYEIPFDLQSLTSVSMAIRPILLESPGTVAIEIVARSEILIQAHVLLADIDPGEETEFRLPVPLSDLKKPWWLRIFVLHAKSPVAVYQLSRGTLFGRAKQVLPFVLFK